MSDPDLEWRCCNCGKPSPKLERVCHCATGVLFRRIDGKMEHAVAKEAEPQSPAPVPRERALESALTGILENVEPDCGVPDCPDCAAWRPARQALAMKKARP